jgi:diketogulonate reductase-like aldo/keto reductase
VTDNSSRVIHGVPVPTFLYGTAWKETATTDLVASALAAGFRGIDTANQPKHYEEEGVGRAINEFIARGGVRRTDLFIQTKFTPLGGQDHRRPYDVQAPVATQVEQSFRSSLDHLGIEKVDSYVLHGPTQQHGLGSADRDAWRAMEMLHEAGSARLLGISNVSSEQLDELIGLARVRPAFVQNRCYARLGWDARVRDLCDRHAVIYQGFSLLTANRNVLQQPAIHAIAARHGRTVSQVIFRFSQTLGIIPLTGTTNPEHMRQALETCDFELTADEMSTIATAGVE